MYRLMFWTDWGYVAKIERANMDGSDRVVIVNTSITWPNGITIDYERDLIYWVDAGNLSRAIEYCDFNGNNRTVLIKEMLLHPFGITLFENHIYWTDWDTDKVERADKLDGKNRIVVHGNLGKLMEVTVVHNDRPAGMLSNNAHHDDTCMISFLVTTNPCTRNNGGCSYMCLLKYSTNTLSKLEASCVCPTGVRLLSDKKTCASSELAEWSCDVTQWSCDM